MRRFEGKTVLVTGGAMGIGAATVQRLAAEGARVIVADVDEARGRKSAEAAAARGVESWWQPVDLARPEAIERMGAEVAARVEALHGLVNCCGIKRTATVGATGDGDWEPQMSINLRAPALCAKALLQLLIRGRGSIVNLSSQGAFVLPRKESWVYDATKLGIVALTRNLASELAGHGIRVNSVAPGWTVTEMHTLGSPDPAARKRELEELKFGGALLGRLARPEEIAAAIAFLLSDDASYVTASTLHVDGGATAN